MNQESFMKVGIIGAGNIAQAVAKQLTRINVDVVLSNSRGPESLLKLVKELGPHTCAGTVVEAAKAEIVVLAVPWSKVPEALKQVPSWEGRILIDTTNPVEVPSFRTADLHGKTSSEIVASLAIDARVVKTMNTLQPEILGADPRKEGGRRVLFMSGDDAVAKELVGDLLDEMGFSVFDLGDLKHGGALHQFPGGPLPSHNMIEI
ncbi:NADPH-dependent F420 reductase [Peredibacter sp. HCB2-198]|uniref:NADPH-dependent F420 reductase n=1 Tax=Peredibacter sp. HCB2-198 TaxID=3383025 RepID=UPI0038B5AAC0